MTPPAPITRSGVTTDSPDTLDRPDTRGAKTVHFQLRATTPSDRCGGYPGVKLPT